MSRMRLLLLSLLALFVLSAMASGVASANMFWIKEGKVVKEGEKLLAESKGGPFTARAEALGVKVEIKCEIEEGNGLVENPKGGGNATGVATMESSVCKVEKPAGCTVLEPIVVDAKLEPILISGVVWVRFIPSEGTTFTEVELKNCGLLNQKYKVTGKTAALSKNGDEEGSFTFNEENNELKLAGNKLGFEGKMTLKF